MGAATDVDSTTTAAATMELPEKSANMQPTTNMESHANRNYGTSMLLMCVGIVAAVVYRTFGKRKQRRRYSGFEKVSTVEMQEI